MPVFAFFIPARSTHSAVLILLRLVSINVFEVDEGLILVMESVRLWCPSIYFTSVISRRLPNWRKVLIHSIISISYVVPVLIRQSNRDLESLNRISRIVDPSIFSNVCFITASTSKPWTIPYSSVAKTLPCKLLTLY